MMHATMGAPIVPAPIGAHGAKFLHNTFVNCGVFIRSDSENVEVANSIFVGAFGIDNQSNANMHHNLFSNPGLTGPPPAPGAPGYRLLPTASTSIGDAPCMATVPDDIDGQARPQDGTCDLGADEFAQGGGGGGPVEVQHLAWVVDPTPVVVGTVMVPAPVVHVHRTIMAWRPTPPPRSR